MSCHENEQLVTKFCNLFTQPDIEKIAALTTEDVEYHNMPWETSLDTRPSANCWGLS